MNKNKLVVSLFSVVMLGALIAPTTASAFWPFDGLFNKGEVKAAVTDARSGFVESTNSNSARLSKSLVAMKSICTDLFSGVTTQTGGSNSVPQKEVPRQTIAVGEKTGEMRNKMPAPMPQEDKKVVAETTSLLALMKNVCNQINTYNIRFDKVYKTTEKKEVPQTNGSQYGSDTGIRPPKVESTPSTSKKSLIEMMRGR